MREKEQLGADAAAVEGAGSIATDAASHGEPTHTPGPWHWADLIDAASDTDGLLDASDDPVLCGTWHNDGTAGVWVHPTNAHLIAAAPALLECARHLRTILRSEAVSYSAPWAEFIAAVDAVIAKAEGR